MDGAQWVCKDGRRMYVFEMTDSHIQHCVNMIARRSGWRRDWYGRLTQELENRRKVHGRHS
jgi:hypothetical protein